MSIITLPATRLQIEAPDGFHYHNDGPVKSVVLHNAGLARRYGTENFDPLFVRMIESVPCVRNLYRRCTNRRGLFGTTLYFNVKQSENSLDVLGRGEEVHAHACVLDSLGEGTIHTAGHEETHVIYELTHDSDGLKVLRDALKWAGIDSRTLPDLPEEPICEIGGFYALTRNFPYRRKFSLAGVVDKKDYKDWFKIWSEWLARNSEWEVRNGYVLAMGNGGRPREDKCMPAAEVALA